MCTGVINDCFDKLCKAETSDDVLGDSLMLWNALMIQCVYQRGIERIDKKLSSTCN